MKDLTNSGVPVKLCGDGSYCCGDGTAAEACCASSQGVFLLNGTTIPHPAVPSSAITALVSTVSVSVVESSSIVVTTTILSEISPSSTASSDSTVTAASDVLSRTSSVPSSANRSLSSSLPRNQTGVMAMMGGTIGGAVVVMIVLLFGNLRTS